VWIHKRGLLFALSDAASLFWFLKKTQVFSAFEQTIRRNIELLKGKKKNLPFDKQDNIEREKQHYLQRHGDFGSNKGMAIEGKLLAIGKHMIYVPNHIDVIFDEM